MPPLPVSCPLVSLQIMASGHRSSSDSKYFIIILDRMKERRLETEVIWVIWKPWYCSPIQTRHFLPVLVVPLCGSGRSTINSNMVAADECEENLTSKNEENVDLCPISPFFRSLYEDFPDSTPFCFVYPNHL